VEVGVTFRSFTVEEQLDEVDALIRVFHRGHPSRMSAHGVNVLKSIAADLRGRVPDAPEIARSELQRRINDMMRSKTVLGFERGAMVGLAQELIGRWPTVKVALEKFEKELTE
jgi:hypothetical protein